jgi:MFS family permease
MTAPLQLERSLLRRARDFRLVFLATVGSGVGTWLAVVALTVDVYDRTHSGTWVSALLMADFLPAIVIGLTLGPLVDRLDRRLLMIAADVVRLAVFCALPFADGPYGIVALAGVAGFASGFFRPAVRAGVPNLVRGGDLGTANALLESVDRATTALGPLLGGVIVAASGPNVAYWVNAATFLVSAALLARVRPERLRSETAISRGHWRDLADGFAFVVGVPALLTVLIAWSLVTLANAGVNVSEIVLAKETFSSGTVGFAVLYAGFGVGLVAGTMLTPRLLPRAPLARLYGGAILVMAIGVAAAAAAPDVWVAIPCVAFHGVGNGVAVISNVMLVQRGAPDRLRGRAFTVIMSTNFALLGVGMVAAGPLTNEFGARWVWAGSAVVYAVAAVVAYALASGAQAVPTGEALEEPLLPVIPDPQPGPQEKKPVL